MVDAFCGAADNVIKVAVASDGNSAAVELDASHLALGQLQRYPRAARAKVERRRQLLSLDVVG